MRTTLPAKTTIEVITKATRVRRRSDRSIRSVELGSFCKMRDFNRLNGVQLSVGNAGNRFHLTTQFYGFRIVFDLRIIQIAVLFEFNGRIRDTLYFEQFFFDLSTTCVRAHHS